MSEPPRRIRVGDPDAGLVRVRHLPSGQILDDVIEADQDEGRVIRYTGRAFRDVVGVLREETEELSCSIRIEWIEP